MTSCGIPVDSVSPVLLLVRELVSLTFVLAMIGLVFDGCVYFNGWLLTGFPRPFSAVLVGFLGCWVALFWVINRNARPIITTVLN